MFRWVLRFFSGTALIKDLCRRGGSIKTDLVVLHFESVEGSFGVGLAGSHSVWGKKLDALLKEYNNREKTFSASDSEEAAFQKALAEQAALQTKLYGDREPKPFAFEQPQQPALKPERVPQPALDKVLNQLGPEPTADTFGVLINQGLKCGSTVQFTTLPTDQDLKAIGSPYLTSDLAWLHLGFGMVTNISWVTETVGVKFTQHSAKDVGTDELTTTRTKELQLPAKCLTLTTP